ncbi:hypothetical protein G5C60_17295 [Streptomyces sp. HC44]|uniref:Uncharacterized protein n=1 Tax=Streptomyces scabichelini TaxID=2711217 RepID=A0A6G4V5D5_9ACTN|nr:hypothetical protein [Streptomyces scabichelini]NGO09308.1 hypothetical protein [Streptomyces scabichelini]
MPRSVRFPRLSSQRNAFHNTRESLGELARTYGDMIEAASLHWGSGEIERIRRETRLTAGRIARENAWVKAFCEGWLGRLLETLIYLAVLFGLLSAYRAIGAIDDNDFSWGAIGFTCLWLLAVLAAIVTTRLGFSANLKWRGQEDPEKSLKFKFVLFITWLLSAPVAITGLMSIVAQTLSIDLPVWLSVNVSVSILVLSLEFFARPLLRVVARTWLLPPRHRTRPYDRLFLRLLKSASLVETWRTRWHESARSRFIIAEIEAAARECERTTRTGRRVPLVDGATRKELWNRSHRIASQIRSHKRAIAGSAKADDFSNVSASLCSGVDAISRGDVARLLDSAPEVTAISRIRQATRRVLPAILLFVAAFTLPFVPGINENKELINSIRVTMIAAGVLALVLPADSPTSGRILDTLTRSLTWKEK